MELHFPRGKLATAYACQLQSSLPWLLTRADPLGPVTWREGGAAGLLRLERALSVVLYLQIQVTARSWAHAIRGVFSHPSPLGSDSLLASGVPSHIFATI